MMLRALRGCLAISATLLFVGLLWSFGINRGWIARAHDPAIVIRIGLGVLIAIPVVNLAGILAASVKQRDWMTVIAVGVVLATLGFNVLWMAR